MLEKLWSMIKFAGIHPLKSVILIYSNIDTFSVSEQKFKYFHKIVWNIYKIFSILSDKPCVDTYHNFNTEDYIFNFLLIYFTN